MPARKDKPATPVYDPEAIDAATVTSKPKPSAKKQTAAPKKKAATKKAQTEAPRPDPRAAAKPGPRSELPRFGALPIEPDSKITADAAIALSRDERKQLAADIERIRARRKPFGLFTQKLALPVRRGYKRHWFLDEPGRIPMALDAGWAHIKDEKGQTVSRVAGRNREGGALLAYAMEIPKVFWDEDMAERHKAAQERMDSIRKTPFRAKSGTVKPSDRGAFYNPQEEEGHDVLEIKEDRASGKPYTGESAPA